MTTYRIHELTDYINWTYFFHAWGFPPRFAAVADQHDCETCRILWLRTFPEEERPRAAEALKLYKEARRLLWEADGRYAVKACYRLFRANSDGDDLLLDGTPFPLLRQQRTASPGAPHLCLSDFVRPLSSGIPDTAGAFAAAVEEGMEQQDADDPYRHMLRQTLADRLAEAAAERLHEQVRKKEWGYAEGEQLTVRQLLAGAYQGIRPAVGYPCLPDLSVNFLLDGLLHMEEIGIRLTESGMMVPHASVCGLMLAHPQARYFSVGPIGEDQLADYARRRGMPVKEIRRFLSANLP